MDEPDRLIYIEFTRPKKFNPLSWIIRAIDCTSYSHVRLRWTNGMNIEVVYEASGTTVKFLGPTAQKQIPVDITHSYKVFIAQSEYRKLVKLCLENSGINYGFKQLVGIGLVKLFRLKKNPFSDGRKSQVCSEIVGRFLQEIVGVGEQLRLDTASPKDIQLLLDSKPSVFRKVKI